MRRRDFITLVGGAAVMRPRLARAQRPQPVIGFLGSQAAAPPRTDPQTIALHQGFLDYGLIQDRDFIFEQRFTGGADERFPEFARDLARLPATRIRFTTGIAGPPKRCSKPRKNGRNKFVMTRLRQTHYPL